MKFHWQLTNISLQVWPTVVSIISSMLYLFLFRTSWSIFRSSRFQDTWSWLVNAWSWRNESTKSSSLMLLYFLENRFLIFEADFDKIYNFLCEQEILNQYNWSIRERRNISSGSYESNYRGRYICMIPDVISVLMTAWVK